MAMRKNRFVDDIQGRDQDLVPVFDSESGAGGKTLGETNLAVAAHVDHRFLVGVDANVDDG